jgi:type IV pilus assembly protein PilC
VKIVFDSQKMTGTDVCNFFRIIRRYFAAGIPLSVAVEKYNKNVEKEAVRKIMRKISFDLENGKAFPEALESHSVFPSYVIQFLKVGEKSGDYSTLLDTIVSTMIKKIEVSKNVSKAVEKIIGFIAGFLVALAIAVIWVLPKTKEMLSTVDAKLPLFTQFVLDVGDFCQAYWYVILFGLILLGGLFLYEKKKHPAKVERMLLKLPFMGPIYRAQIHFNFCTILGLCDMAGIPTNTALEYTAAAIGNYDAKNILFAAYREANSTGMQFVDAIEKADKKRMFDRDTLMLLRVGAEAGNINANMLEEADEYWKNIERESKDVGDNIGMVLITPLTILLLGFLISVVWLPLGDVVQGASKYV